jgi:hypothetical protein
MRWKGRLSAIGVIAALSLGPLAAAKAIPRAESADSVVSSRRPLPSGLHSAARTSATIHRFLVSARASGPAKGGAKAATLVAAAGVVRAADQTVSCAAGPWRLRAALGSASGPRPPPPTVAA